MPERRFFIKKSHQTNTHHIHMVQIGSEFWERHLLFRDFLRDNPDVAQAYASLKIDLAKCEWQDGNEYAEAKTEFIRNVEDQVRKQSGSSGR